MHPSSPNPDDQVLVQVLALPAGERDPFLQAAYANDPNLRRRLQRLVENLAGLGPAAAASHEPSPHAHVLDALELALHSEDRPSSVIGTYRLLQQVGEGGFGVVWLAEQQSPVQRRVALKILKSGMDTKEVIARFEAERQALALMDHPHIARVFDAGATDGGRPYFVMEYVRGVAITQFCDESGMPPEERLRLFIAVCHAVQHAHQKGVVHRDLKPSNILVALQDGVPVPKVIDFGIAKATANPLTRKTIFTQRHSFLGTPAYTSPEQMEMSGIDVDTRTDIYSLGVLLYELLTGRLPFDPDVLMQSGLEAMRYVIREIDPPRPSQHVSALTPEERSTVARERGLEPAKLSLLLRGDLDWIVMHCLEKDRARRYETASALAADVRSYLESEPIIARPPTAGYRMGKFVRRHKSAVAASGAVFTALVVGLVVASVLLVRERSARARAVAAERAESRMRVEAEAHAVQADALAEQARKAAGKSAQVAQFMKDMVSGVGPSVALGRDTTLLREVLETTAQRLDRELRDQPEVATDLRDTLGVAYRELGQFAKAEVLLRDAVAARRVSVNGDHAQLATSLHNLGSVLWTLSRPIEAERALQEALALRRGHFGTEHPQVAETLSVISRSFSTRCWQSSESCLVRSIWRSPGRFRVSPGWRCLASSMKRRWRCSAKQWRCTGDWWATCIRKWPVRWSTSGRCCTSSVKLRPPCRRVGKHWRSSGRSSLPAMAASSARC